MPRDDVAEITEVLTRFYSALLGHGDLAEAAKWAAPDLRLVGSGIVGLNLSVDAPDRDEIAASLVEIGAELAREAPAGPPEHLLSLVHERRGGHNRSYPFEFWHIESIDHEDEDQAHAVTRDASCGLRRVDGEWRVSWLFY